MPKSRHCTRVRRSREQIEEIVATYERSGLTQRDFAARRSIQLGTLFGWLRRLRAAGVMASP